ncbi:bactericidal permeability-increasing protein [Aplysia californica]|uniref:Bactericidal permeability-increasing protein n=1 Tax=Aplysia californica TaxID=6500 RepID=A0ABM0K9U5_APLCA|nr:bactericidal permeability-increasing protein [Aplysia californica]
MGSQALLALVAILTVAAVTVATNPGVKVRITKRGIDYANTVAQAALNQALKTLKIPNQSGSGHHFEWSLFNIQNQGVNLPTSQISLDPPHHGLIWSLRNLGLSLKADWRVKYKKGWVKISDSGSVSVDVKGASVSVSISFGVDKTGRPSMTTASCNAYVRDIDVKFHGGQAFILNLFRGTVEDKIKGLLPGQICKLVSKEVNEDGEAKLAKLKVTVEMAHKFLLDYRLVAAPTISASIFETQHKGEVYWKEDMKEAPFTTKPIPELADVSKMMYVWLTEYTANTYAYAAQTHNYLVRNLTAQDLPPGNRSLLNTTCSKGMCIGKLIPQIGKQFPNSVVSVHAVSTATPAISITPKAVVLSAQGNVDVYATEANKTSVFLLRMNMTVGLTVNASIVDQRLSGKIVDYNFDVGILKSNVGHLNPRSLNIILNFAMDQVVIPMLNDFGKKGFDLPVSGDIKFEYTSLQLLNGSLLVATDVSQTRKDFSLRFHPEALEA